MDIRWEIDLSDRNSRARRVRALCVVIVALTTAPVLAQQQSAPVSTGGAALEEIVITGSRIATANMTSTSPIEVVTAKDMQISGKTDIRSEERRVGKECS
jgi:iron complex outermembrane receptor protein